MYDWKFWLAVLIVSSILSIFLWLNNRVADRKYAEQQEYEAWLAEHGFKPKEKK